MGYRVVRVILMVVGGVLLLAGAVPVLSFVHVDAPWVPGYEAAKLLLMMPIGALLLGAAAGWETLVGRR